MNSADRIADAVINAVWPLIDELPDNSYLRFAIGEAVKRELRYIELEPAMDVLAELSPDYNDALEKLDTGATNDYRLAGKSCWIEVNHDFVVYVVEVEEGVIADIYQSGREMDDALARAWATRSDLIDEEE